jgi:crotonobetainyl-CoA:carnitine CoA-transferase CaiB-like acyl-CoA transferase
VIDLSRVISGPFCSMLLGDLGADVIKIESRPAGDPLRSQGVATDGMSFYFAAHNRNKASLTLDLRKPEGKRILSEMLKSADVLVENFRPGVLAEMGYPQERLDALNPNLVLCSVNGFGETGPYAQRPAFDFIAQAMSGFMSLNGERDGPPMRSGLPLGDLIAGLYAALGTVAALQGRGRAGGAAAGQRVSVSLVDGLLSLFSYMSASYLATGVVPERAGNDHPMLSPYGLYRTADGHIAAAPSSTPQILDRFFRVLGIEHVKEDPRFADNDARMRHKGELLDIIEAVTKTRTTAAWIEILNSGGVPCGPVQDLAQVFTDPQILHQEMLQEIHDEHGRTIRTTGFPLKFSKTPCTVRRAPPELGEHSEAVLASFGFSADDIARWRAEGIV